MAARRRAAVGEEALLVPPWLGPLLSTPFFSVCATHGDASRSERNMFCLDCPAAAAFCFYCRSAGHADHRVIQIRRSSYHDVVRVAEVQRALDISGVQTYVINSARVLFLNERPQPKGSSASSAAGAGGGGGTKSAQHACEICGRNLLDPLRFCSLGCKLEGIKRNGDACFMLEGAGGSGGDGVAPRRRRGEEVLAGGGLREGAGQDMCPATPPRNNPRRRKGIPHRSPLAS